MELVLEQLRSKLELVQVPARNMKRCCDDPKADQRKFEPLLLHLPC